MSWLTARIPVQRWVLILLWSVVILHGLVALATLPQWIDDLPLVIR